MAANIPCPFHHLFLEEIFYFQPTIDFRERFPLEIYGYSDVCAFGAVFAAGPE